jgi:hypothetical protein
MSPQKDFFTTFTGFRMTLNKLTRLVALGGSESVRTVASDGPPDEDPGGA